MALLEKQLFVKKSTIPNSGKGLFTKKFIPKGTRIVEYKGRISAWKDVKDEDGKNGYIFYINRNHVIDALPTKKALARYANDARGLVKMSGITNNCDYISDGLKAYIESKKDIPAGSEIFVDYGKDYWKVIRENIRLWKKEEREELKKTKSAKTARNKKINGTSHKLNGTTRKEWSKSNRKSVAGRTKTNATKRWSKSRAVSE